MTDLEWVTNAVPPERYMPVFGSVAMTAAEYAAWYGRFVVGEPRTPPVPGGVPVARLKEWGYVGQYRPVHADGVAEALYPTRRY